MANRIARFWKYIWRHRYISTLVVFLLIIGLLDPNSWLFRYQVRAHNDELRDAITVLEQQCTNDSIALAKLASGQEAVEDMARVKLFLRSSYEDVYIITEADSLQDEEL